MEVTTTVKYKLNLDDKQRQSLKDTVDAYTLYYNWIMEQLFYLPEEDQPKSKFELHHFVYHPVKNACPDFNADYLNTLIAVSFESFKSQKALAKNGHKVSKKPIFSKTQSPRLTKHLFSYNPKRDCFSIASIDGRIKNIGYQCRPGYEPYNLGQKLTSANLVYNRRHDKFYLHVQIKHTRELPENQERHIACDMGVLYQVVTYDDTDTYQVFHDGNLLQIDEHYQKLRKDLQSKGTRSSKRRLKSIASRQSRLRREIDHIVSKTLVEYAANNNLDTIVVEDLTNIRRMASGSNRKSKNANRKINMWSYFRLQQFLEYKAHLSNINLIKVNPAYTSQTCPSCGFVSGSNRVSRDLFKCQACGISAQADAIAAFNIFRVGKQHSGRCHPAADAVV